MPAIAIGHPAEIGQPDALKAALAEFISMLIFVFAGEGSGMAFSKPPNIPTLFQNFCCSNFNQNICFLTFSLNLVLPWSMNT